MIMNIRISHMIAPFIALALLAGCTDKFDSINANPDESTTSNAAWLATNMLTSITSSDIASTKGFCQPFMLAKYVLWTEDQEGYQYNRIGRTSFGRLAVLRNIPVMLDYAQADSPGVRNAYAGLAHFIRAWQFYQVTMQVGDIPYSEAVQGESAGIIKPRYDTQKDVFLGVLHELDSANLLFASAAPFSGDFIYEGDPDRWRRLVNSFELQVLMQLYRKTDDQDLRVVERFRDIAANRPLMRDYDDNFAVKYQGVAGYGYPWCNTPTQINSFIIYPEVGATLINPLKALHDRRLFYYAEPSPVKLDGGSQPSDWDAYVGVEASAPVADTKVARATGNFSDFNKRYTDLFDAEPVGLFNHWDLEFLLAEAALRGWIDASTAQAHYAAGIRSSMHFLAHYTPEAYTHGMPLTDAYIDSYIAGVPLSGGMEDRLRQVITQKYLAGFLQGCDYSAWYENRRTGYPAFVLNPATNLNTPSSQFPKRWLYPSDELDYNAANVAEAIQRQYGGDDNVNNLMWILK